MVKFISENQKDWDRISLYLLSYRSSKYTTGRTSAKIYFAQTLRLPTDLLRGNPSKSGEVGSPEDYLGKVKMKLEKLKEYGIIILIEVFEGHKLIVFLVPPLVHRFLVYLGATFMRRYWIFCFSF